MENISRYISEKLKISKDTKNVNYYTHFKGGIKYKDTGASMRVYAISTSEDAADTKSYLGFVLNSPHNLEYEDPLGRIYDYKAFCAIKYTDLEDNKDDLLIDFLVENGIVKNADDCIVSFPSQICKSLAKQLPEAIGHFVAELVKELHTNINFFEDDKFNIIYTYDHWYYVVK